jgi:hypothetical protein
MFRWSVRSPQTTAGTSERCSGNLAHRAVAGTAGLLRRHARVQSRVLQRLVMRHGWRSNWLVLFERFVGDRAGQKQLARESGMTQSGSLGSKRAGLGRPCRCPGGWRRRSA